MEGPVQWMIWASLKPWVTTKPPSHWTCRSFSGPALVPVHLLGPGLAATGMLKEGPAVAHVSNHSSSNPPNEFARKHLEAGRGEGSSALGLHVGHHHDRCLTAVSVPGLHPVASMDSDTVGQADLPMVSHEFAGQPLSTSASTSSGWLLQLLLAYENVLK